MKDNFKDYLADISAYEVINREWIEEVNSIAVFLKHKKTGAKVAILSNDDDNKVFTVGFRTPVEDSTGVPHIIEHTVLCGSEKYPVKDPFMELVKGSVNTFINAMTYPDKTVYPVASTNDKDFANLMSTYMDAVFKPNIYNEENIFKQEGWHFELDSKDGELIYNGVVYNEMKGVFSSVDGMLDRITMNSLFPDTGYGFESGGDPKNIPDLTYENYLDFHRRYYHPSNSYIYLYGDMDMKERLEWIDSEYLSKYDMLSIDSHVKRQEAFCSPLYIERPYPVTDSDSIEKNAVLSCNYVIGESTDVKLGMAFKVLDYAIMDMPGAPLCQKLIDEGIGSDIHSQYEDDIRQPIYSIIAKNANEFDNDRFVSIINDTLSEIVENGIDKDALRAGLSSYEFGVKEADFGRYPKGLIFGLTMFQSWLYNDDAPFDTMKTNAIFDELKKDIETDYFENLIKKYLLNNTHKSVITMTPKRGLAREEENKTKEKLAKIKESMSDEQLEDVIRQTKELKEFQKTKSTPEQLSCIPVLKIEDLNDKPRAYIGKEKEIDGLKVFHSKMFTNKVSYPGVIFDITDIGKEDLPYIGLLKNVLGFMDTKKHSYAKLSSMIDLVLGSLSFGTQIYLRDDTKTPIVTFEVTSRMFDENIENGFDLIRECMFETSFDDKKRLKEILDDLKESRQSLILRSGDSAGAVRCASQFSLYHFLNDEIKGVSAYEFICDVVDNYDEKADEVVRRLKEVTEKIFRPSKMILNFAGSDEALSVCAGEAKKLAEDAKEYSKNAPDNLGGFIYEPFERNEGLKTPGQVQFVAKGGQFDADKFTGVMNVASRILKTEYLWSEIRELGGAYGCNCSFGRDGVISFTSYRDPNLERTADVFDNVYKFLEGFNADERDLRKYIIGTISALDLPLGYADRSYREFSYYISRIPYEKLCKVRKEVIGTTVEDIRALAKVVKEAMSKEHICVVGSENAIDRCKERFTDTWEL